MRKEEEGVHRQGAKNTTSALNNIFLIERYHFDMDLTHCNNNGSANSPGSKTAINNPKYNIQ